MSAPGHRTPLPARARFGEPRNRHREHRCRLKVNDGCSTEGTSRVKRYVIFAAAYFVAALCPNGDLQGQQFNQPGVRLVQQIAPVASKSPLLQYARPVATTNRPSSAIGPRVARLPALESSQPRVARIASGETPVVRSGHSYTASLEQRVLALESAWAESHNAETVAQPQAAGRPTVEIFGRMHLDGWSSFDDSPGIGFFENPVSGVDPENRIVFRRLRIGAAGDIFDNMLYKLEYDFGDPGAPAFKDVYIGFKELPVLGQVLFGNQKRPLGLDHLNSSRYNVFMERPLVIDAFNEDNRRAGIAAYGFSADEVLNWRYGVFLLENESTDGAIIGDSLQPSLNGRLAGTPWYDETSGGRGYLHLALAGMIARPDGDVTPADTNANEGRFRTRPEMRTTSRWIDTGPIAGADTYEILATELMFNMGAFSIVGEYQNTWLQRDGGVNLFFHGAYVYVAYFLTGEHQSFDRRTGTLGRVEPLENFFLVRRCDGETGHGWGAWQIAMRFGYLDLSDADIRGGDQRNVTFGLNWLWNAYARMQFNYIYGDIKDHAPAGGFTSGTFNGIGTRFMIDY